MLRGKPEYVMTFMEFVAQQLREIMASLGIRRVRDLVGRTDLLQPVEKSISRRAESVDLSGILHNPYAGAPDTSYDFRDAYNFHLERTLDQKILLKKLAGDLIAGKPASLSLAISSTDRAFGTLFGSEITRRHGSSLPEDTYRIRCIGGAGQSFGAFIPKGLTLELEGDSNDYFGKGLSGGKLIVYPPKRAALPPRRTSSSATWPSTAPPPARPLSGAWPASGSACATPAPRRWWRAWATTAASI